MIVKEKTVILKNGKEAIFRACNIEESQELLLLVKDCASETDFTLRSEDEVDTDTWDLALL